MSYQTAFLTLDWRWIGLSALLFGLGTALAFPVFKRQVQPLLFYPLWVWKLLEKYLVPLRRFWHLFLVIFGINSFSLFVNLLSGFGVLLPLVFAMLLGIHVGVIALKIAGGESFTALFINPVALFELPASWISLSLGMKLGYHLYKNPDWGEGWSHFLTYLETYVLIILPLLFIAGLIEAGMIRAMGRRFEDGEVQGVVGNKKS